MNTPTPWRIHDKTELTVVAQNNRTVANTGTYNSNIDSEKVHNENVANAELIVRAVNYHDRLIRVAERICEIAEENGCVTKNFYSTVQQLLTEIKESK